MPPHSALHLAPPPARPRPSPWQAFAWALASALLATGCGTPEFHLGDEHTGGPPCLTEPPCTCALPHATGRCTDGGGCQLRACERGFADCDGADDNGCEADLSSPDHCGACDNACASCSDSACVPFEKLHERSGYLLVDLQVAAEGQPTWLAFDAQLTAAQIERFEGGQVKTLASLSAGGGGIELEVNPGRYVVGPAGVLLCDTSMGGLVSYEGGLVRLIAGLPGGRCHFGPWAGGAYMLHQPSSPPQGTGSLWRLGADQHSAALQLDGVPAAPAGRLAADELEAYWADAASGRVLAFAQGDQAPRVVARESRSLRGVDIDEASVFWLSTSGGRLWLTRASRGDGRIAWSTAIGRPHGSSIGTADLAVRPEAVYVSNLDEGTISQVDKQTGESRLLIGQQGPLTIAADGGHLYWTDLRTVYRATLPSVSP